MADAKGIDSEIPSVPILRKSYFNDFKLTFFATDCAISLHVIVLYISFKLHVMDHEQFHGYS